MLILKSLTVQPMHGYAIVQHIARLSNGVFAVDHGSLYPALARLQTNGWVIGKWGESPTKRRARYYTITASGRRRLGEKGVRVRSRARRDRRRDVGQLERNVALLAALRYRLRALLRPEAFARELKEEIEFHLSLETMQTEQAAADDMTRGDARYAARRRFGNVTHYAEETRAMSGLDSLIWRVRTFGSRCERFAMRLDFTAVAGLTIALGLGATTAIFSVVNALILQPLPYPDADRIVAVWMDNRKLGVREDIHSYPNLADLKSQNQVLSHLAPYNSPGFNLDWNRRAATRRWWCVAR